MWNFDRRSVKSTEIPESGTPEHDLCKSPQYLEDLRIEIVVTCATFGNISPHASFGNISLHARCSATFGKISLHARFGQFGHKLAVRPSSADGVTAPLDKG